MLRHGLAALLLFVSSPTVQSAIVRPRCCVLLPDLEGFWAGYKISQQGRTLFLEGSGWTGVGQLDQDHKNVRILWINSTGEAAPGEYQLDNRDTMTGHWWWVCDPDRQMDHQMKRQTNE